MKSVLSAILVLCLSGCASSPVVAVTDVAGKQHALFEDRATVLIFVATQCPISNRMVPEINRLCESYASRGAAFYVVYPDADLSVEDVKKHHAEFAIKCPAVMDPNLEWVKRAGASITPEAAVFAKDGRLVYRGRINDLYLDFGKARQAPMSHDLKDAIESVVQGKAGELKTTQAVGCHIPM